MISLSTYYSQWDDRWSKDLLGYNTNSKYNLYNYGCLVASLAMILKHSGVDINPGQLNEYLKREKGFSMGDYIWGSCNRLYEEIRSERLVSTPSTLTNAQMAEIRTSIDNKRPVILQLDYNPKTVQNETHYVVCVDYDPSDENNMTIIDPLGGIKRSLKDYLGWIRPSARNTIYQYIIYDVDTSHLQNLKETLIDFDDGEGNRHSVGWYVYEWANEKTKVLENEKKYQVKLNDRDNKILSLSSEVSVKSKEITTLTDSFLSLSQQISDQEIIIEQLKTQNVSQLSIKELIKIIIKKL